MKIGDVVFFNKNSSFIARGISLFTGSQYTHVGIIYEITDHSVIIAEALAKGFTPVEYNFETFLKKVNKSKMVIKRTRTEVDPLIIRDAIEQNLGRPYGFINILQIAWYKITGQIVGKDDPVRLICSEAVARVLYKADSSIDLSKEYNKLFDFISPADIFHSNQLIFVNPL